ncbi:MAG: response regulator [Proteobacteria bacterium]|nr:response regulator [Pseudomonadota bacterium]
MKILIVDDDATNRLVLGAYLKQDGFEIISANDGQAAIDLFQDEQPDLILMDIMMPVLDGYEATKKIKVLSGERFIPIIFLTSMTDEKALSQCVEVGGDDFLTKPYNRTILTAKINALERVSDLYNTNQRQKQEQELITRRELEAQEQEVARKVFDSILSPGSLSSDNIQLHLSPMSLFNGDVVLAACLVEIDTSNNVLKYWNGAIPAAYLMQGDALIELKSTNLPLGILGDAGFSNKLDLIEIRDKDKIVLSTDGILEAENSNGGMFGSERFLKCLNSELTLDVTRSALFDHILQSMNEFVDGYEQTDDVTLAVINCDIDYINQLATERGQSKKFIPSHWSFELCFYYDALKSIDPIPLINQTLVEIQGYQIQQDKLSTILTELFCNSLDHGLLGLDSKMKSTPEGFMQFYSDKELLLKSMDEGFIKIAVKNIPTKNGGDLTIVFEDSGKGFDTSKLEKPKMPVSAEDNAMNFSGRGLLLIKSYCQSISYNEKGNRVECVYSWSNSD